MSRDIFSLELLLIGWLTQESLFSLTQMILMITWGRAADRFGRKPVLVFSLVGVAVATALFGLSRTVWQMIVLRCLAGVFAGTVV
jgi:MFS family permease